MAVGAVIGAAVIGAAGSIMEGNAADSQARWNAHYARIQAEEDERISRRESSALIGRSRAVTGSQGTTMEGSPELIVLDTAAEAEREAMFIRQGGQIKQTMYQKAGQAAKTAAFFDASSTILGGVGRAVGMTV